jgi:hypothetical protein
MERSGLKIMTDEMKMDRDMRVDKARRMDMGRMMITGRGQTGRVKETFTPGGDFDCKVLEISPSVRAVCHRAPTDQ